MEPEQSAYDAVIGLIVCFLSAALFWAVVIQLLKQT